MDEKTKEAAAAFSGGAACSQAVLGAFCEKYGLEKELAMRLARGLGSGLRSAEVCGAVTGAVLVVGLKHGERKEVCNAKTEEFIRAFREKNGGLVCRELLGHDISTPGGREKAAQENLFRSRCLDLVTSAAQILEDSGY
ncbi:MAG: C-GCAxxG-C-C family protein [Clostridiales bacterium]|nr:C-GCAxxG-C-C family protein [Clostridiales bacterium]